MLYAGGRDEGRSNYCFADELKLLFQLLATVSSLSGQCTNKQPICCGACVKAFKRSIFTQISEPICSLFVQIFHIIQTNRPPAKKAVWYSPVRQLWQMIWIIWMEKPIAKRIGLLQRGQFTMTFIALRELHSYTLLRSWVALSFKVVPFMKHLLKDHVNNWKLQNVNKWMLR